MVSYFISLEIDQNKRHSGKCLLFQLRIFAFFKYPLSIVRFLIGHILKSLFYRLFPTK